MTQQWMNAALEEAAKAEAIGEVPIGAVVVHEQQIVGRGYNRRETDQNPLGHAEVAAIAEASKNLGRWRLSGCELFVTLEPCPLCLGAIQQARMDGVVYGAVDRKGGAISLGYSFHQDPRVHHRFTAVHEDVPACAEVLSRFFKKLRQS